MRVGDWIAVLASFRPIIDVVCSRCDARDFDINP